jgi:lysophospholipase L1-like esterase
VRASLRFSTLLLGVLALAHCASQRWPVIRYPATHRSVIVLGDSLALGVGASTPERGFVALLFAGVHKSDPTAALALLAQGGATANDVADRQLPQAQSIEATDVWLCVGGNDVTHGTSTEQFSANEHALVAAIRTDWPRAHVVVFGVPDVSRSPALPGIAKIKLHNDASLDNDAAADAARAGQADFVDVFAFTERQLDLNADFSADAFHPNDKGYAALADYAAHVAL